MLRNNLLTFSQWVRCTPGMEREVEVVSEDGPAWQ